MVTSSLKNPTLRTINVFTLPETDWLAPTTLLLLLLLLFV
jgi:hypothetical protein